MKFYIKQKVFSLKSRFNITDEDNQPIYKVEGSWFSIPQRFTLYNQSGQEVLTIKQELFSLLSKFHINQDGQKLATVKKDFTFFKPSYSVDLKDWEVKGDVWQHEYEIKKDNNRVATVSKKILSWSDAYEIDVRREEDVELILAIVIVIDANIDMERASANNTATMT